MPRSIVILLLLIDWISSEGKVLAFSNRANTLLVTGNLIEKPDIYSSLVRCKTPRNISYQSTPENLTRLTQHLQCFLP